MNPGGAFPLANVNLVLGALTCSGKLSLVMEYAEQAAGWVLTSLRGGALIEGTEITLSFPEASVGGSGACNTYGGSYTASEDSLRLSGVYATEMACMEPKDIMDQEEAYLHALNAAARYRVDGDRLELYDEDGAQILVSIAAGEPNSVRAGRR